MAQAKKAHCLEAIKRARVRWQPVSIESSRIASSFIMNFLSRSFVIEYHWEAKSINVCDWIGRCPSNDESQAVTPRAKQNQQDG